MSVRFPLATSTWDDAEYQALQNVIESDRFSMGPQVARFEEEFSKAFGSRYAIMVNSGSSANLLMVAALFFSSNPDIKLERGDEIIVPAVSWSTSYFPLCQYGLKVKFVDVSLETLNFDLGALSRAISDKTRAIMAVNLLGNPNDFSAIGDLIEGRNIVLLEDNCESMGATFEGRQAGTFGLMGSFSSFFSHHISTMEGGVVVTDDEELHHIMLALRAHGWTRNLPKFNKVTGEKSDDPFEESFKFVLPGYNLRPLEMSGALGIEQLKKLPALIEGRRKNGALFQEKIADHPLFLIQQEIGQSSWFGFSLILRPDTSLSRKDIVRQLDEAGFECRPIVAGNFAKNDVLKYFDFEIFETLDNADYADQNGLFIGNHHYPIPDAFDVLSRIR
ncbi:MAG TPA: pyridoxamine 5-phosphate oxidase [Rhizobiales bacterium]|nr:pyridoxamine 5-phosphate oxidase [Hyphomicrobiales bacterium]